ncbi:hypothetical protein [Sphingomonas sp. Leaf21]|uniref:hypothetical protein n=1 Tax=Sphingomonas sp. Leaf21 TaxID=2876550 RepID=UPI001E5B59E1|nr:hypothetical protein [Sphingomonas sp. Leaf21]
MSGHPKPPPGWLDWTGDKGWIGQVTGLPDSTLHAHVGMAILVLAALAMRRAPWDWRCWLTVLVIETLNEFYDLLQPFYPTDEGNLAASWSDMWATMLWPTVILLTFRWLARRAERR